LTKLEKISVLGKGYVRLRDVMGDDRTIANAARVSFDRRTEELSDRDERLIAFLAREGHDSPFRHASLQFEVYAPLMIARQWWKYAVGSDHVMDAWNESCLPADEKIKGWYGKEFTVGQLYDRKLNGGTMPYIRSVNKEGEIVKGKVVDVWETGVSDVYEVESELGFKIRTTDNHRYLTADGYKQLKDLKAGDEVMMNGAPAYKNKEWLKLHYVDMGMAQKEIAEKVGCSHHTIRKWVRFHSLQQDQVKRMLKHNEKHGVFGKGLTNETSEIIAKRSKKMSEASKGVPRPRKLSNPIKLNTGHWQARKLVSKDKCVYCEETNKCKLEIHHIDGNPLNNHDDNLEVLCIKHHNMLHGKQTLMVAHPIRIKSIKKVSTEMVYDVEVEEYHNFVSNQFIIHNSRRYITENEEFYVPEADEWRSYPDDVKQGSGEPIDETEGTHLTDELAELISRGEQLYNEAMERGVAPEQARLFLPSYGMYVRWYWTASLQSVAHMIAQRSADDAQYEFREYAKAVRELSEKHFPVSIDALLK